MVTEGRGDAPQDKAPAAERDGGAVSDPSNWSDDKPAPGTKSRALADTDVADGDGTNRANANVHSGEDYEGATLQSDAPRDAGPAFASQGVSDGDGRTAVADEGHPLDRSTGTAHRPQEERTGAPDMAASRDDHPGSDNTIAAMPLPPRDAEHAQQADTPARAQPPLDAHAGPAPGPASGPDPDANPGGHAEPEANRPPETIVLNGSSVAENAEGAVVGKVSGVDPDEGDTLTYTVSDDRFEVVDGSVKLKDGVALDHEAESEIALEVTATDKAGATLKETFTVTVEDLNERPTAVLLDGRSVEENHSGAVIGTLSGVDPDDGDTLTYTVSDDRFEVVDGAVKLRDGVALDHEVEAEIALEVTATDQSGASLSETFTVKVEDQNEGPTAVSLDGSSVAENASGAVIGVLSGVDPDDGDTLTYSVSDERFELVDGAVKLKDGVALDHEAEAEIALEVTVTDQAGATLTETFTVKVEDLNEGPTAVSLDGSSVAENAVGAVIGTLSGVDPDDADTLTYSVSDDRFELVDGAVKLKDGVALDHEAEAEIALEVTATDQSGASLSETFTVKVEDLNEGPTAVSLDGSSVAENAAGAVVGTLSGVDPDDGDTLTYSVSDDRFEVVDGAVKLKDGVALDHEAESEIALEVTATDKAGATLTEQFTVTVEDLNEGPSAVSLDGNFVAENASGAVIGTLSGVDPDDGDTLTYTVSDDRFEVVDGAVKLKDGVALDHEAEAEIALEVTATDQSGASLSETFTVKVEDLNEGPTAVSLDRSSVAENAAGAVIGTLSGVDPDHGDTLTYTLSDDRFEMVDGAVKLKDGVALDHEAESEIALKVTATDQSGATLTETFTVTVEDLNEGPTAVSLDGSAVAENAAGAVVGMLSGVDPDDGDTLTYSVSDDRFEVVDGAVKLKDGVALDHEAEAEIALEVTATDRAGASLSETFRVKVEDLNEGPTAVSLDGSAVAENAAGAVVGTLSGVDPDDGDTLTYSVSDDRFEVLDGAVKLKDGVALDHEAEAEIALEVTATDQAGATLTEQFTVTVEDLNEGPTAVSLDGSAVAENAAGAVVGTLSAVDPDVGDTLTFTVSDDRFEVVDGAVKLKEGIALDHEAEAEIALEVTATDQAGATLTEQFDVFVNDVNEAPTDITLTPTAPVADTPPETGPVDLSTSVIDVGDRGKTYTFDLNEIGALKVIGNMARHNEELAEIAKIGQDGKRFQNNQLGLVDPETGAVDPELVALIRAAATESGDPAAGVPDQIRLQAAGPDFVEIRIDGRWSTDTLRFEGDQLQSVYKALSDLPVFADLVADEALPGGMLSVAENASGAVIGRLSGVDPDDGDILTYTLSDDRFEVVDGAVKLKNGVALDHEAEAEIALEVTATDQAGATLSETFTVVVEDLNEGPTAVSLDGSSVAENAAGAVVGMVSGVDPDDDDTLTYTLSDDRFEVLDGAVKLKDGVALDHEAEAEIALEVTATDQSGATLTEQFTVTVEDLNEGPTAVSLDGSAVAENASGAVVGMVSGVDPDDGDTMTYTLSDDRFEVLDGSVKLKDGVALDHEAEAEIALEVTATDQAGATLTETFTVVVEDLNEAPTAVSLDGNSVAENAEGAVIGMVSGVDPDDRDTLTYTLSDHRFEVLDGAVKPKDGVALDHEAESEIALEVTATDQAGATLTEQFTVTVEDINEAPTALSISVSQENLIKNGSFEAFDLDTGRWRGFDEDPTGAWQAPDGMEVWDNLGNNAASEGDQLLELDHGRGVDSISQTIETQPGQVYDLGMDIRERRSGGTDTVEVYWNGDLVHAIDPDTSDWTTFQMRVVGTGSDVLELREPEGENDSYGALIDNLTLTAAQGVLAENTPGAVVGLITVEDADAQDSHEFSLSDDRFEVIGGVVKLKDGVTLDHETEAQITLEVTATDRGGASYTERFDLHVADMNDAPVILGFEAARPTMPLDVPRPGDTVTLDVTLGGEAYRGDPKYEIVVDGKTVARGEVDWSRETTTDGKYDLSDGRDAVVWKDVSVALEFPPGGFDTVEVRFKNDAYRKGVGDRNLLVDKIAIDGHVIEAEAPEVHYQGGRFKDGATSERMPWRGDLEFDVSAIFEHADPRPAPEGPYVLEGVPGAIVGTLNVSDADLGDSVTISVSDDRFDVVDGALKLKDGVALEFDEASAVAVTVTATDQAGVSADLIVDLTVVDVGELPEPPSIAVEPAFQLAYFDPEAEVAGDQSALSDPVNVGALDAISFDAGGAAVEGMAAQISGQIQAPQDGSFTFLLGDGANTTVFIDGVAVIDNSKAGPFPLTQGVIELEAGTHQIEAIHRDPTAARVFDLSWEGPGLDGGAVAPARAADGDALGIAGEPVDLALDIAADSVVASVTLSGLPTGSIVEASGDLVQADDAGDFDLTGLQNAPLSITPPSDFEGDVSAALTVRDMYGAEVVQPVEIAVSAPPWDAPASTDSASADEEFESVSFAGADETRPDPGSEGAAPEVIEIAQTDDDMSESQSFVGAET